MRFDFFAARLGICVYLQCLLCAQSKVSVSASFSRRILHDVTTASAWGAIHVYHTVGLLSGMCPQVTKIVEAFH